MATRFTQTIRSLATAAGPVIALVCASATQAVPFEPNDNLAQANGPLVGDIDTAGAFETSNDNDYFYFYTSGQVQFQIEVKLLSDNCAFFANVLRGDYGKAIIGDVLDPYGDAIKTYTYTSPGPRKYYLALSTEGCNEQYSFKLSPASAFTTNARRLPSRPSASSRRGRLTFGRFASPRQSSATRSLTGRPRIAVGRARCGSLGQS